MNKLSLLVVYDGEMSPSRRKLSEVSMREVIVYSLTIIIIRINFSLTIYYRIISCSLISISGLGVGLLTQAAKTSSDAVLVKLIYQKQLLLIG